MTVMGEGFAKANSQIGEYKYQAGQARARGIQQRAEALQKAYSLENESAKNSHLAMSNMQALRENQASAVAAALVSAAASGFMADTGSQRMNQRAEMVAWEQQIANANKSNVISDENARMQAGAYRRYGDQALEMANIESDYYNRLAKTSSKYRWWYLTGELASMAGKGLMSGGGGAAGGGAGLGA